MLVVTTGYPEKLSPVVDLGISVGMHRAVDDDGRCACFVRRGDLSDVLGIIGCCEAFIVNDHIVGLCPIRIVVEIDLPTCASAAFVYDGEFGVHALLHTCGQGKRLEEVVVAATARD